MHKVARGTLRGIGALEVSNSVKGVFLAEETVELSDVAGFEKKTVVVMLASDYEAQVAFVNGEVSTPEEAPVTAEAVYAKAIRLAQESQFAAKESLRLFGQYKLMVPVAWAPEEVAGPGPKAAVGDLLDALKTIEVVSPEQPVKEEEVVDGRPA